MTEAPHVLDVDDDLDLAVVMMNLGGYRHLPVTKNNRLVGIVSRTDILNVQHSTRDGRTQGEQRAENQTIRARDVMTSKVESVTPDLPASAAARVLGETRLGCLPVVERNYCVGIVTPTDFLQLIY